MLRRLDWPTCLKPRISVQNLCDSSMSRTLITRWLMPPGVTAAVGVGGTIGVVPSAIVMSPRSGNCAAPIIWGRRVLCLAVEPAPGKTQQPLRQEDHDGDEDDP